MGPNELLYWLSARRAGSRAQFRSAVEEIMQSESDSSSGPERIPLYQRMRFNLQQLGHVEFDANGCEAGWRVVPPVLAFSLQRNCVLNRTTGHSYTQAASCEISSCAISAARSAWTAAVTSGV